MTAPPAAPSGPKTTAPTPAPMPAPSSLPASAVRGRANKNTTIIPVLNAECMTDLSFEWRSDGTTLRNQICSRREVGLCLPDVGLLPRQHLSSILKRRERHAHVSH